MNILTNEIARDSSLECARPGSDDGRAGKVWKTPRLERIEPGSPRHERVKALFEKLRPAPAKSPTSRH